MHKCKFPHIVSALNEIRSALINNRGIDEELLNVLNLKFDEFRTVFDSELLTCIINKFICDELNFKDTGEVSPGYMLNNVPRLGAYFSKRISKLSPQEEEQFYYLIQDLLLRGYLVNNLLCVSEIKRPNDDTEKLFTEWISNIPKYRKKVEGDEELRYILAISANTAVQELKRFLLRHKMRGGSLFSNDKIDDIIFNLLLAGFSLLNNSTGDIYNNLNVVVKPAIEIFLVLSETFQEKEFMRDYFYCLGYAAYVFVDFYYEKKSYDNILAKYIKSITQEKSQVLMKLIAIHHTLTFLSNEKTVFELSTLNYSPDDFKKYILLGLNFTKTEVELYDYFTERFRQDRSIYSIEWIKAFYNLVLGQEGKPPFDAILVTRGSLHLSYQIFMAELNNCIIKKSNAEKFGCV